jgi:hypothetical protein
MNHAANIIINYEIIIESPNSVSQKLSYYSILSLNKWTNDILVHNIIAYNNILLSLQIVEYVQFYIWFLMQATILQKILS